jgi:Flp pilus assembly protein TadG
VSVSSALRRAAGLSTTGAVYAEFIIAVVPMLVLFWGLMQLNGLLLADLVARHAVVNAVRAAIVCDSDDPPQTPAELVTSNGCSYEAAKMTLTSVKSFSPPGGTAPDFSLSVEGADTNGNQPVTVTLIAHYHCEVPLVGGFVCGLLSGLSHGSVANATAMLSRKATLPNQGAGYSFGTASSTQ